jgi:HEAT repeat protein
VPQLTKALGDPYTYVRIFAAGALGRIGPPARTALAALKEASNDPAVRSEAEWAAWSDRRRRIRRRGGRHVRTFAVRCARSSGDG